MKRTLSLLLAVLFCTLTYAQDNAINRYFSDYLDNPKFSKIIVTSETFDLITEIETDDPDEQRVLDAIDKIEGILVLVNEDTPISLEYYTEVVGQLVPDENYDDLLIVEHKEDNVRFMIREDEAAIREFVMVVREDNNFVLASIYGEIDLASISRLAEVIKKNGKDWFDVFKNVDTEKLVFGNQPSKSPTILKNNISKTNLNDLNLSIFPNPATKYIHITTDNGVDAELEVAFYSLLGQPIQKVGIVTLPYKLELDNLPAGAYFLRLTDNEGKFRNFRIVKPQLRQ